MKRFILFFVGLSSIVVVYGQPFKSKSYKTGIYLFCGMELPKRFSYIIESKMERDSTWKVISELKAPTSEAVVKGVF